MVSSKKNKIKSRGQRTTRLGIVVIATVFILGLGLLLYFLHFQQDLHGKAAASTTLSLSPANNTTLPAVGSTVTFDVMVDPGTNAVSLIKLELAYDPAVLQPTGANALVINSQAFSSTLEGPIYSTGSIAASISIGSDTTKIVTTGTKVATVTFTVLASTPTEITFTNRTFVGSLAPADSSSENVLSTTVPATLGNVTAGGSTPTTVPQPTFVCIGGCPTSPTPTVPAQNTPTPQATATPTLATPVPTSPIQATATPTLNETPTPDTNLTPTTSPHPTDGTSGGDHDNGNGGFWHHFRQWLEQLFKFFQQWFSHFRNFFHRHR